MIRTHDRAQSAVRRTTSLLIALLVTVFLAGSLAACGGGGGGEKDDTPLAHESENGAQVVDIVSKTTAFDKSEIRVAGGEEITIQHDNQDDGIPHNFAIYKTSEANDLVAATEIEPGPVQQELIVEALEPGEYFFRCDTHPTLMTGTFIVEES
jgi:plastocyanin